MFCAAPVLSAAWAGMTDSLCRLYHEHSTYARLHKALFPYFQKDLTIKDAKASDSGNGKNWRVLA